MVPSDAANGASVEDGLRISAYLSEQLAETGYQFPAEDPQKAAFSRAFNSKTYVPLPFSYLILEPWVYQY
jgi:hypothetical protein